MDKAGLEIAQRLSSRPQRTRFLAESAVFTSSEEWQALTLPPGEAMMSSRIVTAL